MIPSVLQELKEGRYEFIREDLDENDAYYERVYQTESGWWVTVISDFPKRVRINGKTVRWFFGWRIRRALKKASKK